MTRFPTRATLTIALLLIPALAALGQPVPSKAPSSTHVFPAGARRGTTVRIRVGAECIPPGTDFFLSGKGVAHASQLVDEVFDRGQPSPRRLPTEIPITYPRQWDAEVTLAADAGPVAYWRISCAQGGTPARPFVIGDLPEFIESESNSTLETAEPVELPVTVNGQIHGERDMDFYSLDLEGGQLVSCEVLARRIASRLDPVLTVLDSDGQPIDVQRVHIGDDPVIAFRAPSSGRFYLQVQNVSFHGDAAHVYRLNLTSKGFARYCFPLQATAGEETTFQLYCLTARGELETLETTITAPNDGTTTVTLEHPQVANQLHIPVSSLAHTTITQPSGRDNTHLLMPGTVASGRFVTVGQQDWFRIPVRKGQSVELQLSANRESSGALPIMDVLDSNGKRIHRSTPQLLNSAPARHYLPEAGEAVEYLVRVRDLRMADPGGKHGGYTLQVADSAIGFSLRANTDVLNVGQESSASLEITLQRQGGFAGEVKLGADGLPEGVVIEQNTIAENQNKATVKFTIPADAAAALHELTMHGVGMDEHGEEIRRPVRFRHAGVDGEGMSVDGADHEQLGLVVAHKPVFRLFCSEAYLYAHRGSIFPYFMEVERLNDFEGAVTLEISDRQNRDLDGIQMLAVDIAGDEQSGWLPIYLPETMHINVQSQSQLYCQGRASFVDAHGKMQHVLVVSEKRNMLRTLPPVVKLESPRDGFTGSAGSTVMLNVTLNRTSNYPGAMTLTLSDANSPWVSMEPVNVDAGQTDIALPVSIDKDATPGSQLIFTVRGDGPLDSNPAITIITEVTLRVTVEAGK